MTTKQDPSRIGFLFSGGGALIAQELALAKALIEGLYPQGRKVSPAIHAEEARAGTIAGASTGAISSVFINAIIEKRLTWRTLEEEILFPLKNKDIYEVSVFLDDIADAFERGFILNTRPLKKTLKKFIQRIEYLNYHRLGELPLPTYISAVNRKTGQTRRFYSESVQDANLDLVQILLASSATPIIFPERKVDGAGTFVDGGTGPDNVPVKAFVKSKDRFDELYVITYKHTTKVKSHSSLISPTVSKLPVVSRLPIVSNIVFTSDVVMQSRFRFQLANVLRLVKKPCKAFLYMPEFDREYDVMEYGKMKSQYEKVSQWAQHNNPQYIYNYLKRANFPFRLDRRSDCPADCSLDCPLDFPD
ncbi:MAG: patatin-like phospholipase family protein [Gammaproteobacteria bacterium]|nr:patatin-like phospholipase family protein [Gammaproteobacteria bacterium]